MQKHLRVLGIACGVLFLCATAIALAQTQNHIAKFGSSGQMVNSVIYEVDGRIGVGTNTPLGTAALDVSGGGVAVNGQRMLIQGNNVAQFGDIDSADGTISTMHLRTNDTIRLTINGNGHVGIGTMTPAERLHVAGVLRLENTGGDGAVADIAHQHDGNGITSDRVTYFRNSSSLGTGGWAFRELDGGDLAATTVMKVQNNGRVGIGTPAPEEMLHVLGNVKVNGNIAAKYQDIAEWVDVTELLDPGTVVVVAPDRTNAVARSAEPYSEAVAGVVSEQPGVILGERTRGRVPVAQSGRVRVRVDPSFGAIAPGDLLVTSPTPGFAMKSIPISIGGISIHRPGTILGKALEGASKGKTSVMVLLTLQ